MFQENNARQIFRKMNISYPLVPTCTYAYQEGKKCLFFGKFGKKCSFFGKFGVLCFLETPVLRFALSPHYRRVKVKSFSGANVRDMHDNIKSILRHKLEYINLHWYVNDALNISSHEIRSKRNIKIKGINKDCRIII